MCEALGELGQAIAAYAAGFDVDALAPGELAGALEVAGQVEKVAATLAALIAARMARLGPSGVAGRQAERALARSSGTSLADARRAIEAGRAMSAQPEVLAAAHAGALSRPQAGLIADAVALNPGAAPTLVDQAGRLGLAELAEACARAKAAAVDLDAQRQAVQAARSLRAYTNRAGAWHLHACGPPTDGAQVMAVLSELATGLFDQARRDGRRERPEAYLYDALGALVALATGGDGRADGEPEGDEAEDGEPGGHEPGGQSGPALARTPAHGTATAQLKARLARLRPSFLVRSDIGVLLRGYPVEGEVCEIAGYGPISAQAAIDLIDTMDPFLKAIVTDGHKVVGVAHLGRRPNAYQRSALDWLYPTCAAEGCPTRAGRLQSDHRADWARRISPCSTYWTACAPCTTASRPARAGGWSRAGANGPSSPPRTRGTPATALPPGSRPRPRPGPGRGEAPERGHRSTGSGGARRAPNITGPGQAGMRRGRARKIERRYFQRK